MFTIKNCTEHCTYSTMWYYRKLQSFHRVSNSVRTLLTAVMWLRCWNGRVSRAIWHQRACESRLFQYIDHDQWLQCGMCKRDQKPWNDCSITSGALQLISTAYRVSLQAAFGSLFKMFVRLIAIGRHQPKVLELPLHTISLHHFC